MNGTLKKFSCVLMLGSIACSGCATPDYLLPQGFSSTYQHAVSEMFQRQSLMYEPAQTAGEVYRLPTE